MILNVGEGIRESEEDEGGKLPVLKCKLVEVALVPEHYHVIELLLNITVIDVRGVRPAYCSDSRGVVKGASGE